MDMNKREAIAKSYTEDNVDTQFYIDHATLMTQIANFMDKYEYKDMTIAMGALTDTQTKNIYNTHVVCDNGKRKHIVISTKTLSGKYVPEQTKMGDILKNTSKRKSKSLKSDIAQEYYATPQEQTFFDEFIERNASAQEVENILNTLPLFEGTRTYLTARFQEYVVNGVFSYTDKGTHKYFGDKEYAKVCGHDLDNGVSELPIPGLSGNLYAEDMDDKTIDMKILKRELDNFRKEFMNEHESAIQLKNMYVEFGNIINRVTKLEEWVNILMHRTGMIYQPHPGMHQPVMPYQPMPQQPTGTGQPVQPRFIQTSKNVAHEGQTPSDQYPWLNPRNNYSKS